MTITQQLYNVVHGWVSQSIGFPGLKRGASHDAGLRVGMPGPLFITEGLRMDAALRESIVWAALAYVAGKRTQRDLLADGSNTKLAVDVTALINGRAKFSATVDGVLHVGEPAAVASSSAPDAATLLALALLELTPKQRDKFAANVLAHFEKTQRLPDVADASIENAKALLKRLRATKNETRRGSVSFAIQPRD